MSLGLRLNNIAEKTGWPLLSVLTTYLARCDELTSSYYGAFLDRTSHIRAMAYRETELYYKARKHLYGKIPSTERTQSNNTFYKIFR